MARILEHRRSTDLPFTPSEPFGLIRTRLASAIARRSGLGFPHPDTTGFRLVNAEGDGLSGLVVDRFDDVAVAQLNSMAMAANGARLAALIAETAGVGAVITRTDAEASRLEGIAKAQAVYPESAANDLTEREVSIKESGIQYALALGRGQKTGFYFDQRENRARFAELAAGQRVLDLYSYVGAFGLGALRAGAREVIAVETSKPAAEKAIAHAALNGVSEGFRGVNGDVVTFLRDVIAGSARYDRIVCDPPKFVRSRSHLKDGLKKYIQVNTLAMDALAPGGMLLTCSCSGHVDREAFLRVLTEAGHRLRRGVHVHGLWGAGADHPFASVAPQTDYLKAALVTLT